MYGPDGQVQKTLIGTPPEQPSGGKMKQKIIAKKKAEMKDYMQDVKAVLSMYVPPDPQKMQAAYQAGKLDAYIYGYPLVVMDSVRRVSTNVVSSQGKLAPMGQFAHYRSFPDASKRDLAGSNVDTLYSLAWLDLSLGPYVLHLPDAHNRFYLMPILDGWTEVIGSPGTRTTGDKAGDYAITGPQWAGALPAGVKQIKSDTNKTPSRLSETWVLVPTLPGYPRHLPLKEMKT